jgi:hypothetical protein
LKGSARLGENARDEEQYSVVVVVDNLRIEGLRDLDEQLCLDGVPRFINGELE